MAPHAPQLLGSDETLVWHARGVVQEAQPVLHMQVPFCAHVPCPLHVLLSPPGHTPSQARPKYPSLHVHLPATESQVPWPEHAGVPGQPKGYGWISCRLPLASEYSPGCAALGERQCSTAKQPTCNVVLAAVVVPVVVAVRRHEHDRVGRDLDVLPQR